MDGCSVIRTDRAVLGGDTGLMLVVRMDMRWEPGLAALLKGLNVDRGVFVVKPKARLRRWAARCFPHVISVSKNTSSLQDWNALKFKCEVDSTAPGL